MIFKTELFGEGQQLLISNNPEIDLIILATEENIRMLARYPNWFCDSTFDSAPIGHQLYTVHALVSEDCHNPFNILNRQI